MVVVLSPQTNVQRTVEITTIGRVMGIIVMMGLLNMLMGMGVIGRVRWRLGGSVRGLLVMG